MAELTTLTPPPMRREMARGRTKGLLRDKELTRPALASLGGDGQRAVPGSKSRAKAAIRLPGHFSVGDIVFLAILAAALTIVGALTMPLAMTVTLFGVRNAAAALFYGLFGALALTKVRRPGALVLLALFNGVILLMM
ncbi:MAG: hypothetical protein LBP28_06185, partial [Coriobacteriales bacterium]|nr:hypothetical protein [Coriobacteriales bacterium]